MNKAQRIGPKMKLAVEYVTEHPGCCKAPVARHVFHYDRGWRAFGYAAVNRAINAGLIVATRRSSGTYTLTVTAEEKP